MAWYAEQVRRESKLINKVNMVLYYKLLYHAECKRRYEEWYVSLTDEQKERLEQVKKEKKERNRREVEQCLKGLSVIYSAAMSRYFVHHSPYGVGSEVWGKRGFYD